MSNWVGAVEVGCGVVGAGGVVLPPFIHLLAKRLKAAVAPVEAKIENLESRFDDNDEATRSNGKDVQDLRLQLAREFGGNSGGMRQAINEIRADTSDLRSELKTDLASLRGAFEQHIREKND